MTIEDRGVDVEGNARPVLKEHSWISNPAFYRMTGVKWICMDCRIGVARRTDVVRKSCPGRPIAGIAEQSPSEV
jgi:hypothetical protein